MNWEFLFKRKEPVAPNLAHERDLGAQAQRLIKDAAFQRAFRNVREGIHLRWSESPVSDRDGQHELRLMLKLLDDLEGNIKQEADSGLMAEKQMIDERERETRKRETRRNLFNFRR